MKVFKKDRFSIRKIKGVVGSVFLGSLLMAPSVVDAATYHYVDKEVISQEAKDLIQTGKPDGNEVVYGLVYQKDQLPQTGTEASVLTAFGLLTVGSLLLIYKKKKIASVFLVGAMGLVVLPSAGAVDPVATLAPASREGVVEMEGYRYVGYLSGDILKTLGLDTVLEEASAKPGEVTVVEVENPQVTTNQEQAKPENQAVEEETPKEEAPRAEENPKEELKTEVKPTDEPLPKGKDEKESSAELAPVEEVGGVVESTTEEKAPVKPESQPSDKQAEDPKVETPVEQPKVPEQPVQPTQPEQPSIPKESSQQEDPKEDKVAEETPKQEDAQPEVVETKDGAANQPVEQPKVEQAGEPVAPSEDEKAPVSPEKQPEASKEEKTAEETPKQEEQPVEAQVEPESQPTETSPAAQPAEHQDEETKVEQPAVEHKTTPEEGVLNVIEVKPEVIVTKEPVPFKTVEQDDENLAKGETRVIREGVAGERTILTEVTTIDGKQSSKVLEDTITTKPVDEIKGIGTKEPVDKSELKNQIDKASSVSPTDYSTASYNALGSVLEAAKTTYSSESVKQEQVDSETDKLKTAIEALTVDKTELNSTITDAKTKTKEHYSDTSWQNLQTEVTEAEKVAANTDAKQSEVDSETASLKTAISGLNTDKAELENQLKIAQGKTETDFSMGSWTVLSTAQNKAQEVKDNGTATQDQINDATKKLKSAIAALSVDKIELNKTIADAKSKTKDHYSDATWANLQTVLADAENVTNNTAAKQSEINHINEKLKSAIVGLNTDKTELEKQLHLANEKTQTDYSATSWNALEEAKTDAQAVKDNDKATQAQIKDATDKLKVTIDSLNVDKTKLQEQLTVAEQKQQADYSTKTWNEFKNAELKAKEINNQTTSLPKQSEIDAATKALQDALQALAVDKTVLQNAINTANSKRKEEYTTQTWKALEDTLTEVTPVNADETATQSKVDETTRSVEEAINNLVLLTEKPVLTFIETDKKVLEREAVAKYSLENQNKTKIKSITATLKKGETVVSTVELTGDDVTNETISAAFKNLEYYKEYTLSTTMVYDRGDGDVTEILDNQPIQLDLKKVEIKDIKRTDLIKYENGKETNESLITTIPDDKSNYYLKITSNNQKTTLLAVQNIEETTVNGTSVYKVTAIADNLVSRTADNKFEEEYVHYIEKPKAHEDNVYYNFKELIEAIENDPSKEYRLGQSMSARNVVPNGKSYITKEFTGKLLSSEGKQFAITELEHPLFDKIKAGTVKNINFENIDINVSNQDNIATIANEINGATRIENIKATGTITARNNVAGFVNNIKENAALENVAFIGNINSVGNNSTVGGIAGSNYMGFVNKAYVEANITATNASASMLVPFVTYMLNSYQSGTKSKVTNSVAKGTLDVKNTRFVGGVVAKTWPWGVIKDIVTYARVIKGEEVYGSNEINDGDARQFLFDIYRVNGASSGSNNFTNPQKIKQLTREQADAKVATFNITADKLESELSPLAKLNEEKAYSSIQDYKAEYNQAYKNLEKLIPFYNKDYIVYQGNKLNKEHPLNTKEVLSVTAMNNNEFITNLDEANKIIVHYADGTKDYFNLSSSSEGLSNVKEYTITDLGIKYTPNIVQKDNTTLVNDIKSILESVELQSQPMYQHLNRLGDYRVNAIKDLYLEESFTAVKENLTNLITKLVQNEEHQLNDSPAARQMLRDKVEKNKAAILLGLTYLNRYYGVKFGDVNIKELMLFKPDFYGKEVDVLDRLIEIGSREDNIKGHRTYDAFSEIISKTTLSENLVNFLNYNRRLFTADVNIYDWFKKATEGNVYIAERASEVDEIKAAKYKVWDNLQSATHRKMILPLLNLNKSHVYLISNYSAMAVGTAEKLGHSSFDGIKNQIEKAADSYRNYFDFWYRLSLDKVKNMLVKNTVTPLWEGYQAPGGWPDKYGKRNNKEDYAPLRELFGPIGKYYGNNGTGAYAVIWDNPLDTRTEVNYIALSMIDEFGISVYTHETTHVNDRAIYLGGYGRRSGTHAEAYAQGMLQTPVPSTWFDEYGALGINMTFYRPNDGNQWYITDPKTLKTREDIDNYMKGYIDTLSLLDYVEGDAVISKHDDKLNQLWFKKVDPIERTVGSKDQYDKVRNMSSDDWKGITLNSVNDLVDNNLMTNRMMNNNIYKPEVFDPGIAYVGIKMMNSIYAGNTSEGAPGAVTFKNNAFRLWGYYGYDKGFLGYASDKLKSQANKEGKQFGDQYIIQKISDGRFQSFADFKKEYYKELLEKANAGFNPFTIDGETIHNYDELKSLFAKALEEDMVTNKVNGKLVQVKEKVYKKLLQQTNSFKTSIFK